MAIDLKRFTARFVEEAREHLKKIDGNIAVLDAAPNDAEAINAVFRAVHTIKGSGRMLKFAAIADAAHALESVLAALREGGLTWSGDVRRLVRRGADALAGQIDATAEGRAPAPLDERLAADLAGAIAQPSTATEPTPPPAQSAQMSTGTDRLKTAETVRVALTKLDDVIRLMGEVVSSHARLEERLSDIRRLERRGVGPTALTGFARDLRNDVFAQKLLMKSLHDKALALRMLPLSMVLDPSIRLVRDLSATLGKDVECVCSGADIELDRQLIDRLGDPLVHLLRNAVDHGIEPPDVRKAAGKPAHGTIRIDARADGGGVVIEVSDDGGGLPLADIRDKAVRKHLIGAEQATAMSDAETVDLIFTPGFSTSAIVTDVSGRGVGMDVVKRTVVDEMQGMVTVETMPTKGTTFRLRLPLTLAVMRILLVSAGGHPFGIAAQYVHRLLDVPTDKIRTLAARKAVVLDSEFVPVVSLASLLGLSPAEEVDSTLLVVIRRRGEKMALAVDSLLDERDMVLKPLPAHMHRQTLVSGVVVTGRNALVGVLHAPTLFERMHAGNGTSNVGAKTTATQAARKRILVVDDSFNAREIVKDVLEAHRYEVALAENGRDGLRKALEGAFDAVITDVEMPLMDGFSLTEALRADERYRDTPVIIVTSRAKLEDKRRGIAAGANAYIVKGDFDQNSMADTLNSLLG